MSTEVRAEMVVDIRVGNWDDGCTLAQLREQATREARIKLRNIIEKHGGRVVKDIKITFITTVREP